MWKTSRGDRSDARDRGGAVSTTTGATVKGNLVVVVACPVWSEGNQVVELAVT